MNPTIAALRMLPRNALSRVAGRLASLPLPGPLQRAELRAFSAVVGVDLSEARDPIESFPTLQAFFARALREGVRPVDPDPRAVVSPCDGAWGESGHVEQGQLLQIKGRPYSLASLLGDAESASRYEGGPFATLYLSPRDYHRFHFPIAGAVRQARSIPGTLWPVNRAGLENVDGLFAENERIVVECTVGDIDDTDDNEGTRDSEDGDLAGDLALCMVAVGATMVGRVRVDFDDLTTNQPGAQPETREYASPGHVFTRGREWGHFEFGSTLVLIAAPGVLRLDASTPGTPVRLGTRIGERLG